MECVACIYTCTRGVSDFLGGQKKAQYIPGIPGTGIGVRDGFELPCGYCELNLDPLQEDL